MAVATARNPTDTMRLLVVEDDQSQARFLALLLREEGYAVDVTSSGREGWALAAVQPYDGILLDLTLPDADGVEIIQRLRRDGVMTPILVLTGRKGPEIVARALDAGADEYVAKPVAGTELKARVRVLLRHPSSGGPAVLHVRNVALDRMTHQTFVNGAALSLTPKEFSLLEYFLARPGEIVTRTELLEKIWDMHFDPGSNVVDALVSRLRSKLDRALAQVALVGRRGIGFVLEPQAAGPLQHAADNGVSG